MSNLGMAIVRQYERGVVFRLGKRGKIIAAECEALSAGKLARQPIALQLRNLQVLSEIAIEHNSTISRERSLRSEPLCTAPPPRNEAAGFPAQLMESVHAMSSFLDRETPNGQTEPALPAH